MVQYTRGKRAGQSANQQQTFRPRLRICCLYPSGRLTMEVCEPMPHTHLDRFGRPHRCTTVLLMVACNVCFRWICCCCRPPRAEKLVGGDCSSMYCVAMEHSLCVPSHVLSFADSLPPASPTTVLYCHGVRGRRVLAVHLPLPGGGVPDYKLLPHARGLRCE